MTKLNGWKMGCVVFAVCAATTIAAQGQTFTTLVDFDGEDGAFPVSVAQGLDGNFYGTTSGGGGLAFRVSPEGALTTIFYAGDWYPSGLVISSDGNFYGTMASGGKYGGGTVFKLTPSGRYTTLYNFCAERECPDAWQGWQPTAPLIQGSDGNLYGTTSAGGTSGYYCIEGCGTVFKISLDGMQTTLHRFSFYDGMTPYAPVVQGIDGDLYGTTDGGGQCQYGVAFKVTREGQFTLLNSFCPPAGARPGYAGLAQATDGNFYGTTAGGGINGEGNVFKMTSEGTLTSLHDFDRSDGSEPSYGVLQATDGNLYGTTSSGGSGPGFGTLFQITLEGALRTLHFFAGSPSDGEYPGPLIQGTNGKIYGTTVEGGPNECGTDGETCGTIFSLDMGLGPFVTFARFAGKVGDTGPILGQGLTGTTSVAINGIQANFTVVSDTEIRATVPEGATTGYVTVTTPTGILTSNVPFHVIP